MNEIYRKYSTDCKSNNTASIEEYLDYVYIDVTTLEPNNNTNLELILIGYNPYTIVSAIDNMTKKE